jgi:hypothetical protein
MLDPLPELDEDDDDVDVDELPVESESLDELDEEDDDPDVDDTSESEEIKPASSGHIKKFNGSMF